jgi:type II secretory pathway pseudopilin PulG
MTTTTSTFSRRAFTLIELLFATSVGLVVAGSVVLLLFQSAREQKRGLVNATVEENAYILQSKITAALRSASADRGLDPDYTSSVVDAGGTTLGYQSVKLTNPTNGATARISYTPATGRVIYTPNVAAPTTQELWMTNGASCRLTNLLFNTTFKLDGTVNSSLVGVSFLMDDNGYSQQNRTNNPASVLRNFCIQMRND